MKNTKLLTLSALFSTFIFIFTAYIGHIPVGAGGGYIHMGDTFIYLAAVLLPFPFPLFAGAIGAGLADFVMGGAAWIPFTVVIKPIMALCFTAKSGKILKSKRNIAAPFIAGAICIILYYCAEAILYGSWITPFEAVPGGILKLFANAALYFIVARIIDERNWKGGIV